MRSGGVVDVDTEVYNVPGASGTSGLTQFVGQNAGDPHQLMVIGKILVGAVQQADSAVSLGDTTPIARLTAEYDAIAVTSDSKYETLEQLMSDFESDPGSIAWGGGSIGGVDQILVAKLGETVGVEAADVNDIPYSGGGELTPAILSGDVDAAASGLAEFTDGDHRVTSGGSPSGAGPSAERAPAGHLPRGELGARIAAAAVVLAALVVLAEAVRIAVQGGVGLQQPGFFPMVVGIGLLSFGVAFLLRTTVKPDRAMLAKAAEEHGDTHWRTLWLAIGGLVIYVFVLDALGYIIATSGFFLAIAWVAGSRKLVRDIVVAVLFAAAVYFGFTELLGVRLPAGVLGDTP